MNTALRGASTPSNETSAVERYTIFAILALVMLVTRGNIPHFHFAPLPDASWAVFFIAGFYLSKQIRWAFPLLMIEAVVVDYFVISGQGISFWDHYCVSAAYWFLLPAYAALTLGGVWLRSHFRGLHVRQLGLLAASAIVAITLCYLISNGSFYWISDSVPAPRSMGAWLENLSDWYLPYLQTQSAYVAIAAAVHVLVVKAANGLQFARSRKH